MLLNRKKSKDRVEADRQRVISYKKFFSSPEGKDVLFDLMNKFHILNTHNGNVFSEGQRSVVLHMMAQANIDLVQYDKIIKGEFDNG